MPVPERGSAVGRGNICYWFKLYGILSDETHGALVIHAADCLPSRHAEVACSRLPRAEWAGMCCGGQKQHIPGVTEQTWQVVKMKDLLEAASTSVIARVGGTPR